MDEPLRPAAGTREGPRAAGDGDDGPLVIEEAPACEGLAAAARRRRLAYRALAVAAVVLAAYALLGLFGSKGESEPMHVAEVAADPQRLGAVSGRTSEEYKEKVDRYSRRRAEASLKEGGTFVAPVSEVARPREVTPATAPKLAVQRETEKKEAERKPAAARPARRETSGNRRAAPAPTPAQAARQERMERNEMRRSRGDADLVSYLGSLRPQEGQPATYVFNRPAAARSRAGQAAGGRSSRETATGATAAAGGTGIPGVLPGDILYCINRVSLNSDAPGPAMVEVVAGSLRGAKVIGSFQRLNKHLVLRFSRLVTRKGVAYTISGYAIDPATDATAVRSGVDNHYLERWGGIIAASFLQGFGEAVENSGMSTTTSAYGTSTTYPDYRLDEQLWLGAARVGDRAATLFESQFSMPPTVTLKGGTEIGVLLLDVGQGRTVGDDRTRQRAGTGRGRPRSGTDEATQDAATAAGSTYAEEIAAEQAGVREKEAALAKSAAQVLDNQTARSRYR